MERTNDSIGDRINKLARETDAPESFVQRIRDLFSRKGIALGEDCTPYRSALEHAFLREQRIRRHANQTRENLLRLQSQLSQINSVLQAQLKRLQLPRRGVHVAVRQPSQGVGKYAVSVQETLSRSSDAVARFRGYLVPGPKDIQ